MGRVLGVIPARMAATRLPGKPLVRLGGRELVRWVHDAAAASDVLDEVVVATDSDEVASVVRGFGGRVELTSDAHESGTDRVAEVAARSDADIVVNIQGDQPFVTADMIRQLVAPFADSTPPVMTTLGCPLSAEAVHDPNVVKVVCDRRGDALYFSRSPIPFVRTPADDLPVFHHLGLYAFERSFLLAYAALPPTPLERCEGLEQLRALEHGHRIRVAPTGHAVLEVNTAEDAARADAILSGRSPS